MSNALLLFMASLLGALHTGERPTTERPLLADDSTVSEPPVPPPSPAPTWPIRFFFENRKESLALRFFDLDNAVEISRDAMAALSHHLRCFRTDRERPIHPRLAEIVARVTEAFGRENVDVISGFRAPPYGAPHSKHFRGRAMDLRLPGVPSKKVAAWVWKNFRGVGVGYYPKQNFVHVDVRPDGDVRWVDTSLHGESAHARYSARKQADELLADAPRLAYDQPLRAPIRAPARDAVAALSGYRGVE